MSKPTASQDVRLRVSGAIKLVCCGAVVAAAALRLPAVHWNIFGGVNMTLASADAKIVVFLSVVGALLALLQLAVLHRPRVWSWRHHAAVAVVPSGCLLGAYVVLKTYKACFVPGLPDVAIRTGPAAYVAVVAGCVIATVSAYETWRLLAAYGSSPERPPEPPPPVKLKSRWARPAPPAGRDG